MDLKRDLRMSSKPKINKNAAFFHDRAEELRQLKQSLASYFTNEELNLTPLEAAAKELDSKGNGSTTLDRWGYDIKNLTLPMGDVHNIEPAGIQPKICVNCSCESNVKDWNTTSCDPFNSCEFRVSLIGDYNGIKYTWGMHIDKETRTNLDEWHPLYHLHCFESRVDSPTSLIDDNQKKGTFLLNVPRLMHYPLDIVLGIGFCLMNFYKKEVFKKLYENDQQFPRLYRKSRDRILKPYLESLAGNHGSAYEQKVLCPQVV